ncbi:MAG: hypothetical protein EKK55_08760 [Rhodocyclaceae bacterium]|nr:MAG: hypothetical protein EKK55_08760 [Rhodocyclaceae bacterium]
MKVIAVRPGSGRIEGTIEPVENPKTFLQHRSATVDLDRYKVLLRERDGVKRWSVDDLLASDF